MTSIRPIALVVLLSLPVAPLPAQQPQADAAGNPITSSFRFMRGRFGGWLVAAFDSIPASRYGFRPTPVQQSVGYVAQHLEDANYGLCDRFGAMKHPRDAKDALPDTVKAAWPKDTLVARLRASFAYCDAAMAQVTDATLANRVPFGPPNAGLTTQPARALLLFVTDLAEHYSQLSTYMRLIGVVPPSALPPRPRTAIELTPSALAAFVGAYDLPRSPLSDAPTLMLEVTMKDGALYMKPGPRPAVRLWPETPSDFFVKEVDAQVSFVRDGGGAVTGLVVHQGGEDRPARRVR